MLSTSTVRRGSSFCFCTVIIRWQQVTGFPSRTTTRTPSLASLSIEAFTSRCQCKDRNGFVDCNRLVFLVEVECQRGPSIRGSVWHSQVLKALDRYLPSIQFWRAALLVSVAGNGRAVGNGGGSVRMGQERSRSLSGVIAATVLTDMGYCVADPMRGKSLRMIQSALQASRLKYALSITTVT